MHRREFLAATAIGLVASSRAMAATPKLRVAVIGNTPRGKFGHDVDKIWLSEPETEIVAVADPDAEGLEAAKKRLNIDQGFADYRQMLSVARADLVAVCPRYVDEHHDMIMAAIDSGARGIYVEKPICRTPAEADDIVAACTKKNVKLAIAHRNRYHPALPVIARLIKEGAIGKVIELRGRGKEDDRGGPVDLWVLGSHVINLGYFLAGNPTACSATLLQDGKPATSSDLREGDDAVGLVVGNELHAHYELESGVPMFFDSVKKAGNPKAGFGLQVIGSEGIIDIRIDAKNYAHLVPGNPFMPTNTARPWTPITSGGLGVPEPIADVHQQMQSHHLAAHDLILAMSENRQPLCSAADGAVIVESVCAAFASHRAGGLRLAMPLTSRSHPFVGPWC